MNKILTLIFSCLLIFSCQNNRVSDADSDYLLRIFDAEKGQYGYVSLQGDTVISMGKYSICYTDTFRTYAIVAAQGAGFIGIDREENVKYYVFPFDNGPDYVSEGYFRIVQDNKIGFVDSVSGEIAIMPQFACALSFKNGVAEVAYACEEKPIGEYYEWTSNEWFLIDKNGRKVADKK